MFDYSRGTETFVVNGLHCCPHFLLLAAPLALPTVHTGCYNEFKTLEGIIMWWKLWKVEYLRSTGVHEWWASRVWHFGFETSRFRNFSFFLWYRYRFRKILVSKKVSVSVSKNFGIEKKYRYRFRKKLVLKKVSVSVSENFGIEKSIGIGFDFFGIVKYFLVINWLC